MSPLLAVTAVQTAVPRLRVDLEAVASNTRLIASRVGSEVMAVVKADGFGHGAVPVATAALANGATSLGVATIGEALELRAAGITAPVLSWLNSIDADYEYAIRRGVDVAVPGLEHLSRVSAAARRVGRAARIHLHVDCGMSRDGAARTDWFALGRAARAAELRGEVRVAGVMGHLPCAEVPGHPSTDSGRRDFLDAVGVLRGPGLRPVTLHLAATAAALGAPATRLDLVRIGAGLYGIGDGLRPTLTLTAPVVTVRDVAAGTAVGYGHTWVADRATRLALVPLGYGDGIPRVSAAVAEVSVHGRRRRIAGRVSMDQLVIDVGDLGVRPGDEVTIFGTGDDGEPTVTEWSAWSHTIPHEIMTGLGQRIARTYGVAR